MKNDSGKRNLEMTHGWQEVCLNHNKDSKISQNISGIKTTARCNKNGPGTNIEITEGVSVTTLSLSTLAL